MMFVRAFCLYVQIGFGPVTKGFKKVEEHFHGHFPDHFPFKTSFPNQPVPAPKIYGRLREAIVHRQAKTVTLNSEFVSQGFAEHLSKSNGRIFYGVMLIYFQISLSGNFKVHLAVAGQLIQHMIEKSDPG